MKLGDRWHLSGMTIHGDLEETDNPYQYGNELTDLIQVTYQRVVKGKIKNPHPLLKLIKKYPNVPSFKNYLTVHYNLQGKKQKAYEANKWLMKEHPEYLYGKLNLCAQYLDDGGDVERVADVLGKSLSLSALYPNRASFHASEFISFTNVVVQYLLATDRLDAAESHYHLLQQVMGADNEHIKNVQNSIERFKRHTIVKEYISLLETREAAELNLEEKELILPPQKTAAPEFQNPEINRLYKEGLDIDPDFYNSLLKLPRQGLLKDLRTLIQDALERYEYFKDNNSDPTGDFYIHAWGIAADIKAKEILWDLLLSLDVANASISYFWLSDHTTETIWQYVYRIIDGDLNALFDYVRSPELGDDAKMLVTQTIEQISIRFPEKREEIISFLHELFPLLLKHLDDPLLYSNETITHVLSLAGTINDPELIRSARLFFDLQVAEEIYFGGYEDFVEGLTLYQDTYNDKMLLFPTTLESYNHVVRNWHKEVEEDGDDTLWEFPEETYTPQEKSIELPAEPQAKIGRNQPCPCGSGRKYKHCCLKKVEH